MSPSEAEPRPTVVVTIDGLRAAALGAYGQTAYETPAFDAVAATGTVFDWCYAPTPDPTDLVRLALDKKSSSGGKVGSWLLTDSHRFATAAEDRFESVETLAVATPQKLATGIETTRQAAVWLRFAESLVQSPPQPGETVWLHTEGLRGAWDAPAVLLDSLLDDDDPPLALDPRVPTEKGQHAQDPEARFAAGCRYAMQVLALDVCLSSWLEVADAAFDTAPWRLVLAGARGFPLGEHGSIGGDDPRLYSEQQHVPLLVRNEPISLISENLFAREQEPARLDQALLSPLAKGAVEASGVRDQETSQECPQVSLSSPTGAAVLRDTGWLLRRPGSEESIGVSSNAGQPFPTEEIAELYVKPDDRWEQNDIASREREIAEQMLSELASRESGMANDRPGA